ncbi:MAG: cytochrome P450 [Frankia sp.]
MAGELRWAVRHGLTRIMFQHAARRGDLAARIVCDSELFIDPFPAYDLIRSRAPLLRGALGFSTASHSVATDVLRGDAFSVERDSSGLPAPLRALLAFAEREPAITPVDPPSMLVTDPPDHSRYRRLVTRVFTPRAIEALRGRTEQIAEGLLDEMVGESAVDLVDRYASALPVTVISEILGVPLGMRDQFLSWGNSAAVTLDIGISRAASRRADRDIRALDTWVRDHFNRLRRDPGEDILSRLVSLVDDGDRLTEDELAGIAMLLLGAGFETTANLIGNGVETLLRHPDQLRALLDEPAGWPNAIEEILRYESPVQTTARFAKDRVALGGVSVSPGPPIVVFLGGANRDPEIFTDPNLFDITRPNARDHVAFSSGAHYCLGAGLARMEGETALRMLFERFPDLALAGPPHRRPTRTLRGWDAMPVAPGRTARTGASADAGLVLRSHDLKLQSALLDQGRLRRGSSE